MLKKFTLTDKSTFLCWLVIVLSYVLIAFIGGWDFDIVWLLAISNLALFPSLLQRSGVLEERIDDPLTYVTFNQEYMILGNNKVKITDIRKVALEAVGQDAYFSLPYNQVKPGHIPNMVFAADKMAEFKQYLKRHLASHVVFIQ